MRSLKKLLLLVLLAALATGAVWAWTSPYGSLVQIDRGLDERDLGRVERYADLEELVRASTQLVAALASEQAGVGGGDLGSSLLSALVGVVAAQVGEAAAAPGAAELRRAVLDGRVTRALGPFQIHDGWRALGPATFAGDRAVVELHGQCGGQDARLGLVFAHKDVGPLPWPGKWVLVGVDPASVKALAKTCRAR